ncbi:MAG: hydantoinase/oxoprolinase family protein, partial [Acetobacterales bacterium]
IGGNGPVHAAGLADALEITRIMVPPVAGLFSALGLIFADVEHQSISAFYHLLHNVDADDFRKAVAPGIAEVTEALAEEEFDDQGHQDIRIYAQVQYEAQASSLTVALPKGEIADDIAALVEEAFHQEHERTYGYRCDGEPIQVISLKVVGRGVTDESRVPDRVTRDREDSTKAGSRKAFFGDEHGWLETQLMPRTGLKGGTVQGPLIVEEYDCTTVIPPGWSAALDEWNNIVIEKEGA